MTFAAVTLLGMTVGQPLGPDYYSMNSPRIQVPIEYKKARKDIRQVLLYVSKNGENTWYQEAAVTPDKDAFVYVAKEDGVYWFKLVIVDLKGNKDPADVTADPPDLKVVIDTLPPRVRVTGTNRNSEEILIKWAIEDKFPNPAATKVHFRPTALANADWQEVTVPADSPGGVRFPCRPTDAITVKITAADVAGNRTEITQDIPAPGVQQASTSLATPSGSNATPVGGDSSPPHPMDVIPAGPGPVAPGPISPGPITPPAPGPATPPAPMPPTPAPPAPLVMPPTPTPTPMPAPAPPVGPPASLIQPVQPSAPPAQPVVPTQPLAGSPSLGSPTPLPTIDPKAPPAAGASPAQGGTPTPGGYGAGGPPAETPRAQVINYPRFELGYDLEQRGPSGISRVDLWVTRDEGRSWRKWSQHDGKNGSIRVVLDVRENGQLEGNYGFRLVPVSGAGLSEREPASGDAPELRVVLDTTTPHIDLFPPVSDPNAPDTLLLQWKATDRNFGDDPITLEWSESPTGPWKPIASTGNEPVVQATAISTPVARRLANTGQYAWRVPVGVPARVYLKATARDAGGNVKEVVTRDSITVDLTRPRAKISGIAPVAPAP